MKDVVIYQHGLRRRDYNHSLTVDISEELINKFKKWLPGDVEIYNLFKQKLISQIASEGADFAEELNLYRNITSLVGEFCQTICAGMKTIHDHDEASDMEEKHKVLQRTLYVSANKWGSSFRVSLIFCYRNRDLSNNQYLHSLLCTLPSVLCNNLPTL